MIWGQEKESEGRKIRQERFLGARSPQGHPGKGALKEQETSTGRRERMLGREDREAQVTGKPTTERASLEER